MELLGKRYISARAPTCAVRLNTMPIPQDYLQAIIFYEWRRGTLATATVHKISSAFRKHSTPIATIHRWCARFEEGDKSLRASRAQQPQSCDETCVCPINSRHGWRDPCKIGEARLGHGSTPFLFN
ncbi:unnamed protein product [Haemonchus placei]|uniref:Mos1 transposase HTH domain-containing protein n=1 Tax=Haemonchus placei TaxID=6290 RepID=A0A3P7VW48_HAEPC|nr:unnamed protein product [Haemonchus placei]